MTKSEGAYVLLKPFGVLLSVVCHAVALAVGLAFVASPHKLGQLAMLGLPLIFVGALGIISTLHDALGMVDCGRPE